MTIARQCLHAETRVVSASECEFITPRHLGEDEHTHVGCGWLSMSSRDASRLLAGATLCVSRGSDVQQAACLQEGLEKCRGVE